MKLLTTWAMLFLLLVPQAFAAVEYESDISANVSVTTSFDNNTGLYTYRYTITNYGESTKRLHEFHIPLRGAVASSIISPEGWRGAVNQAQTLVGWCACKPEGIVVPPDYVDDGRDLPSKFAVNPGGTLSGFSFQSPYPPSPGVFYAGAWVPIPIEGVDFPIGQEPERPEFPQNMRTGAVDGPLKSDTFLPAIGCRPAPQAAQRD